MAESPSKRRPWRLQFSLKLLLVVFTAFAIGFPIWYRWPYEETESFPGADRIVTWQRQWGGGRAKQGLERYVAGGKTIELTWYRNGLRHGPYESQGVRGNYENDLKEGIWTAPDRTSTWHHGRLDGLMEIKQPPARPTKRPSGVANAKRPSPELRTFTLRFAEGRLTHFNDKSIADSHGKAVANRLFDLQGSGAIDARTEAELGKFTTVDVVEMPLKDVAMYLSEAHGIPIVLDSKLGPKFDLPLTGEYRGIDFSTALLLLTAPNGLACDYRYGCIWITTAEDANDWRDRTGVAEIKLPRGSALERAWTEVAPTVEAVETPLTEVLAYLKQPLAIDIDTSQIEESSETTSPPLVTTSLRGLRFCDLLGQLLYKTDCQCRLEEERLVVLPPLEKKVPTVAKPAKATLLRRVVPAPAAPTPSAADPFAPGP